MMSLSEIVDSASGGGGGGVGGRGGLDRTGTGSGSTRAATAGAASAALDSISASDASAVSSDAGAAGNDDVGGDVDTDRDADVVEGIGVVEVDAGVDPDGDDIDGGDGAADRDVDTDGDADVVDGIGVVEVDAGVDADGRDIDGDDGDADRDADVEADVEGNGDGDVEVEADRDVDADSDDDDADAGAEVNGEVEVDVGAGVAGDTQGDAVFEVAAQFAGVGTAVGGVAVELDLAAGGGVGGGVDVVSAGRDGPDLIDGSGPNGRAGVGWPGRVAGGAPVATPIGRAGVGWRTRVDGSSSTTTSVGAGFFGSISSGRVSSATRAAGLTCGRAGSLGCAGVLILGPAMTGDCGLETAGLPMSSGLVASGPLFLLSSSWRSRLCSGIGLVGSSTFVGGRCGCCDGGGWRTMTFLPVGERMRVATGVVSTRVTSLCVVLMSTRVTSRSAFVTSASARRRGMEETRLRGLVFGSSCGRISFSIAARTAPSPAGRTNTNVDLQRAASALLSIAEAPISW